MEDIERAKQGNLGQLLLKAARLYNQICVTRMQRIHPTFTMAHTALLPHLEFERGVRPTELAQKLGTSKQAVNQLLNDLQRGGMVERTPDPVDGRARLVVFTEKGRRAVLEGLGVLKQLELEVSEVLPQSTVERLKTDLATLLQILELE